jgi:glycosyltransferase involved in cell wall biosynthesis
VYVVCVVCGGGNMKRMISRHLGSGGQGQVITVVVPVYNVERYLDECLRSIARQTVFDRCEVILVDDGSTDRSTAIAERFAAGRPNVRVLRQANAGPGAARNVGLDLATTKYVVFCDSDDVLPRRALASLLHAIESTGVPVAVGILKFLNSDHVSIWEESFTPGVRVINGVGEAPDLTLNPHAANKIYDVAYLREHGHRFEEAHRFEDAFLVLTMLMRLDRIALTREVVYLYRRRPTKDSIMDSLYTLPRHYWDHLRLAEVLSREAGRVDAERRAAAHRYLVRGLRGFLWRAPWVFGEDDLRQIYERALPLYRDIPVETIIKWAEGTRYQVPYLALKLGDFDLFARPAQVIKGVVARGRELFLDLPGPVPEELSPLTRVHRMVAEIEQVRRVPDTNKLELTGRFVVVGLPIERHADLKVRLQMRSLGRTFRAFVTPLEPPPLAARNMERAGFRVVIPVKELDMGLHDLRLVVYTDTGRVSRPVRVPKWEDLAARTVTFRRRRLRPLALDGRTVQLLVHAGSGVRARLGWYRRRLALALPSARRELRPAPSPPR